MPLTSGRHGTGAIGEAMGAVCGFVVDGVYFAGDTIWCDEVGEALERHRPRAVVVNAGGARFNEGGPIVMDVADVARVRAATDGPVVVVHLEAVNHCIERRDRYCALTGVPVPDDGATIELSESPRRSARRSSAGRRRPAQVRRRPAGSAGWERERRACPQPLPSGCRCASPRPRRTRAGSTPSRRAASR